MGGSAVLPPIGYLPEYVSRPIPVTPDRCSGAPVERSSYKLPSSPVLPALIRAPSFFPLIMVYASMVLGPVFYPDLPVVSVVSLIASSSRSSVYDPAVPFVSDVAMDPGEASSFGPVLYDPVRGIPVMLGHEPKIDLVHDVTVLESYLSPVMAWVIPVIPVGMPLRINVPYRDRNVVDLGTQPEVQGDIHPAHAPVAEQYNGIGMHVRPLSDEEYDGKIFVADAPITNDDHLSCGDPVVFAYGNMESVNPVVTAGDPHIPLSGCRDR